MLIQDSSKSLEKSYAITATGQEHIPTPISKHVIRVKDKE
jgi:hypothetical protein